MINLTHDGTIDIATGKSRKETNWRNREILLSALYTKLSEAYRTYETYKEYLAMKPDKQAELKDRGGFVGGMLSQGRRKASSVVTRQLLTLDLDFANKDFWDDFTRLYSNSACIYSTHKHSPDKPRLRLVMPLDRAVTPEEYVAIGRRIAGMIGIEQTDPTSFEPSRLMYWPSSSKDGEWVFELQDGEWLNADAVLATYKDWKDSSEWPMASGEGPIKEKHGKPLEDPREKQGWIGVFCRMFDLHQAIERFLPDVYTPGEPNDRYTFNGGSTANGLIVYDEGLRSWSNHSTDPTHGRVCNAFDLVRIHKFGHLDDKIKEGTNITKYPSFKAMEDMCLRNKDIVKFDGLERRAQREKDFADVGTEEKTEEPENEDWLADMEMDRQKNYVASRHNFKLILLNDPLLKSKFAFDQFSKRKVVVGDIPWRKITEDTALLTDEDECDLRIYLAEKPYSISHTQNLKDVFDSVIAKQTIHPVKDYLKALKWDGQERLERLFIDYIGASDTPYTKAITRKSLVAAVARVFKPGIKFDHVLTLVGPEGMQKSTILKKIAKHWFSDSFSFEMLKRGKEAFEQIIGYWLVEIGELNGMRNAEIEMVKHFITKGEDVYRIPHSKYTSQFKRQCVFFASTNNWNFLKGATGNRRFWPMPIHVQAPTLSISEDLMEDEIDQVWAEAKHLFQRGEKLYLDAEMELVAREYQRGHTETDERYGMIVRYLNMLLPTDWDEKSIHERRAFLADEDGLSAKGTVPRNQVCAAEIWCEILNGQQKDMTTQNTKFIHDIMQSMEGWERSKSNRFFARYGAQRAYLRQTKCVYLANEVKNTINTN